jgi:hypothetical protein
MTALIKHNPQLPAALQKLNAVIAAQGGTIDEFSGGVTSGFPIISYKGKVWAVRKGGETQQNLDADGNAIPVIDVVLVRANPAPSKIFYAGAYVDGDNSPPTCFSNDGIKPDASVQNPINAVCASCPNNAWGSKINNGKKLRACADARRMAVVMSHDLAENGDKAQLLLLRVPAASLNPLKDYVEKTLAPKGIPPFGVISRIGFDAQEAHPQFTFKATTFVNDEQADAILKLRDSEDAKRILAESEFPAAAAGNGAGDSPTPVPASGGTPASAPAATTAAVGTAPKAAPKMRAATEEEAGLAAILGGTAAQTPAAAPAAPVATPAAPKPAAKKATPKPAAAAVVAPAAIPPEEEESPVTVTANGAVQTSDNFEGLLDSILNA